MKDKNKQMKKHWTENKGGAGSDDFYDWWDALEYNMRIGNGKSRPVNK